MLEKRDQFGFRRTIRLGLLGLLRRRLLAVDRTSRRKCGDEEWNSNAHPAQFYALARVEYPVIVSTCIIFG